jgi:tetraacyldisaccharide 4'-kinase
MRAPGFWWRSPGLASAALTPFGAIYGAVAVARLKRQGTRAGVPVICIGDPTVGGAGKTPAAIALAELLKAHGENPFFVTRGYGGREPGPLQVDLARHDASEVGDEPLLLARAAATVVSADRVAGAALATQSGASVIVLDDGFQNPALSKDCSLLMIDGGSGAGNGLVFPAGPLRAPLAAQIERAQAVVIAGSGKAGDAIAEQAKRSGKTVLRAAIRAAPDAAQKFSGKRVLAYAGIGRPEKFFRTLAETGAGIAERRAFPDHHVFNAGEARALLDTARDNDLVLATTEKDQARMARDPALRELAAASRVLAVALRFEDEKALMELVGAAIRRRRG